MKRVAFLVGVAIAAFATRARADDTSPATHAIYDAATAAMDKKDFATACPKLEQVVKLVPDGVGARMTLGQCYEGADKLASARDAYLGAAATATRLGQAQRATEATASANALKLKLATLTITIPPSVQTTAGLSVMRDGALVTPDTWGTPVVVDNGSHTIAVTALHKKPWTRTVDVSADGASVTVPVDSLADDLPQSPSSPAAVAPPEKRSVPPLAIASFAIGGAGIVVGTITGVLTITDSCHAHGLCPTAAGSRARATAWASDVSFGVGVVGAAVGVIAIFTIHPKSGPTTSLMLGAGDVRLIGTF